MDDSSVARLQQLLADYGARLKAIVRARCPLALGVDPDEVEQDVRLRVWQALAREKIIEQPASYLYQTTMSVIVDHIRRRQARPDLAANDDAGLAAVADAADPQRSAEGGQFGQALQRALADLPPRRRQPVQLHLQGFGTADIGRLLQTTEATARNLVYRGLDELRERLKAEGWQHE
jgi:RNA polymerase sigma factor (sigma-70 family)